MIWSWRLVVLAGWVGIALALVAALAIGDAVAWFL